MTLAHNVAELLKSPLGAAREVVVDEPRPRFGPELRVTRPVQGTARLLRTQHGVLVRAHLATAVELDCSRCLEPVEREVAIDVEEEFRPSVHILTGAPLEAADDAALQIDEHHVLDLTEAVRQYVSTALPLQPLCASTCRGLCTTCGKNLNEGPCDCGPEPAAPAGPFAALAELLERRDKPA